MHERIKPVMSLFMLFYKRYHTSNTAISVCFFELKISKVTLTIIEDRVPTVNFLRKKYVREYKLK